MTPTPGACSAIARSCGPALLSPFTTERRLRLKIEQRLDDINEILTRPLSDHLNPPPPER